MLSPSTETFHLWLQGAALSFDSDRLSWPTSHGEKNINQMKTLNNFENEVMEVDDVKTVWLRDVFLTRFMYVHTWMIKKSQFFAPRWHLTIFQLQTAVENDVNDYFLTLNKDDNLYTTSR